MPEKKTKITISENWSNPLRIESGKDIYLRFSKDYLLINIKIEGKDDSVFMRSIYGKGEQKIIAEDISHIESPIITFCLEGKEKIEAELYYIMCAETNINPNPKEPSINR